MDRGQNLAELRVAQGRQPALRQMAADLHPGSDDLRGHHIGQPGQNAARADTAHGALAHHGLEEMRDRRLAHHEFARAHEVGHELQERMQPVEIEAHGAAEEQRLVVAVHIRGGIVEDAFADGEAFAARKGARGTPGALASVWAAPRGTRMASPAVNSLQVPSGSCSQQPRPATKWK